MNKREYIEEVIEHLEGLADGSVAPRIARYGLCSELYTRFHWGLDFSEQYAEWPENVARDCEYPVPVPEGLTIGFHSTQYDAYHGFKQVVGGMWHPDSAYGSARRRLCLWLAEWLEENIDDLVD